VNFKKISFSNNLKNVGKLSLGTILGQFISIISLPIFTWIYGPTIIGNWALFNAVAIIINSFSDLGLTDAIMTEENKKISRDIYKIVSTVSLIISVIVGVGIYTLSMFNGMLFGSIGINSLFVAATITIFIFTSQQVRICSTWLNKEQSYNVLMKNPIVNNITVTIFGVVLAFSGLKDYGYYIGIVLGQIITLVYMKRFLPKGFFIFNINQYLLIFKKHQRFIIYQTPSNIILQFKGQLPTLLISMFFGSKILGYYDISMRLVGIPITLLANSLGRVFFQSVSEIKRKGGQVGEFTLRGLNKAMKISLFPIILMLCIGDMVITLIFGEDFFVAGNIFRIMTFYGLFLFLSMSVNGIAIVIDKQKFLMISGILQVMGISIGMLVGAKVFESIYISILLFALTFIIIQIVYFCFIFKVTNISIKRYLNPLFMEFTLIITTVGIVRGLLLLLGVVETI
jgi:O-antigen/teichoic acid export membrane protein